jgi:hypothetical protein
MARHPKSARNYRRRGPVREPYDLVLIVCEGEKTEPEYFRGLRKVRRLSNANIEIVPSHYGNDPVSLVRFAIDKYKMEKGAYQRMYCVFDRNGHAGYQDALNLVANSPHGKAGRLFAITSIPCFEVWVLLHFHYSTAAHTPVGNKSGCDRVIDTIKTHFPGYQKAFTGVFDALHSRIDDAISNARKLSAHNAGSGSPNPATKVHELDDYLRGLKV